jgi:protein CWC15
MTTAARPTWEPAKGGNMKGETDLGKLSMQVCDRDLPSQMTLKYRMEGQVNVKFFKNYLYFQKP